MIATRDYRNVYGQPRFMIQAAHQTISINRSEAIALRAALDAFLADQPHGTAPTPNARPEPAGAD